MLKQLVLRVEIVETKSTASLKAELLAFADFFCEANSQATVGAGGFLAIWR